MITWDAFYDYILPEINGLSQDVADAYLRRAAIDFFEETLTHVITLPAINVVAGTSEYTLVSTVTETEPVQVKAAWCGNLALRFATLEVLNESGTYWRSHTSSAAYGFTQFRPDQITLYPKPDTNIADALVVQLALAPTLTATWLDDWVAGTYREEIVNGAKAMLMAMPNRPWTDSDRSNYYKSIFEYGKTVAKADSNRSFTRAALTVAPRPAVR
jgi:hypothetical protein